MSAPTRDKSSPSPTMTKKEIEKYAKKEVTKALDELLFYLFNNFITMDDWQLATLGLDKHINVKEPFPLIGLMAAIVTFQSTRKMERYSVYLLLSTFMLVATTLILVWRTYWP